VLGLLLRPRLAGHHQLGATLTVAGLRGPERSFAVAEVSFRVAGQGALQQSIHIDARSQRVGIFENIGSQPTGGLVDEGRWRRVELVPVDESDPEPDAEPLREGLRAPGVVTAVGEVIEVEVEGRRGLLVEVEDPALRAVLAPGDRLQVTVIGTDARGQALLSTRPPAGREPDAGRTAGASVTRSTDPGSGGGRPPAASVTEVVADLAEALRTAPPGARLVVRGRHRGPLTISQPVELRGEEAILEAERGPVLLVQADAVLRGLVVRGTARPGAYAADAVEVRSGRVSLHECDLRSDASGNLTPGRAVAVTGPATVELRGCRIHHSGVGVAVDVSWGGFATTTARGARVGLQDCRIVDNALGVAVAGAGREVRAVGCTFSGNADAAVRALPGATAVVEDSEVDRASLIADPGATLDARGNRS